MNNLQIFNNEQFGSIRTIEENGKVLFCGSDVAKALGYSQTAKAVREHCKEDGCLNRTVTDKLGREQIAKFINEGNLYRLIANSKLPTAEQFESWVFDEVLPTIRRTGTYSQPMSQAQIIAAQANLLVEIEKKTNVAIEVAEKADKRISNALDILAAPSEKDWQTDTGNKIKRICSENQLSYLKLFGDLYQELEDTAHIDLSARVRNLKTRMKKSGATYKERQAVSKLYVISLNPALRLAFDGIVRRVDAMYTSDRLPQKTA